VPLYPPLARGRARARASMLRVRGWWSAVGQTTLGASKLHACERHARAPGFQRKVFSATQRLRWFRLRAGSTSSGQRVRTSGIGGVGRVVVISRCVKRRAAGSRDAPK